ncbi:MAG TPA: DUF3224 domain-containing protein [Candidatus Acidoferrales bacterium]
MKNSFCVRTSNRSALAAALGVTVAFGAAATAMYASGISISSFHSSISSTSSESSGAGNNSATQRKSGGHSPSPQQGQSSDANGTPKGATVMHAKGTFEVKIEPQGEPDKADGSTLTRMSIDKKIHGDLEATTKGTMLAAGTDTKGSAGYVAIERVTGTLDGKTGSFVLQHNATMTRGTPMMNIIVVPDSGTGQLTGLTGNFLVIIAPDGKHSYEFNYTLPTAQ